MEFFLHMPVEELSETIKEVNRIAKGRRVQNGFKNGR